MRRLNENEIVVTQEELDNIREFIDRKLDSDWDHHTDHYICSESWEDGKRRMDPEMYDMAKQMVII